MALKSVLIFVLSSHKQPYEAMINTAMTTWDSEQLEGTRTVYYCGEPAGGDTERVISFPVWDDYQTIGYKNLLAFQKALHWPWDYMARVNASCYVHKRRLLEHVQTLPQHGVMQGIVSPPDGHCETSRPFMWGGGQFIFSRDVIECFVENSDQWQHNLMEDVAMSELAQRFGYALDNKGKVCSINLSAHGWTVITYNGKPSFDVRELSELSKLDDQFFIRCKYDLNRAVDADIMRALKEYLTP